MSLRSRIIQTCLANVHKEINQLEHWLLSLPEEGLIENRPLPSPTAMLTATIEKLSKQLEVQQHTIHHLVDRLDVLERQDGFPQEIYQEDLWLDGSCTQLQNEIIEPLESLVVHKIHDGTKEETHHENVTPAALPATLPAAIPVAIPTTATTATATATTATAATATAATATATAATATAATATAATAVATVATAVAEKKDSVSITLPADESHVVVIQEEEEEEEEGLELERLDYKGKTYYRDPDGFIYQIDDEDQPSDSPIGYWKEKTQSIAFYRTSA